MKQPLHTQIAQSLACVLVYLFIVSSAFAAGERNTFDPRQFSTGEFHTCPAEGHARRFDPYLDALKNRDLPPPSVLRQGYTVPQLNNALAALAGVADCIAGSVRSVITRADRTATHRKSDRSRVYLCAGELRKRSSRRPAVSCSDWLGVAASHTN